MDKLSRNTTQGYHHFPIFPMFIWWFKTLGNLKNKNIYIFEANCLLVGGFFPNMQPSNWIISPRFGVKKKIFELPPPSLLTPPTKMAVFCSYPFAKLLAKSRPKYGFGVTCGDYHPISIHVGWDSCWGSPHVEIHPPCNSPLGLCRSHFVEDTGGFTFRDFSNQVSFKLLVFGSFC